MAKLPININATYEDSKVDASIALHQQHHDAIHDAVNNQVSRGDLVFNLRDHPGVIGDGQADDSLALQVALKLASKLGARAFAKGTFRTTRTIRISGNADLSDATIMFYGEGTAVEVRTFGSVPFANTVRLPRVIAGRKTRLGWAQVAGCVGVVVQNSSNIDLMVPYIQNFETGLVITGSGRGTAYCNVTLGHLNNNKHNLRLSADGTGWVNQNNFYGGRLSHNPNEGTQVPGTRQILIDLTSNRINSNNFWGTSLESTNVAEYHLDCAGIGNQFVNCRWENAGSGARVIWRADSDANLISNGYGSHVIVETAEPRAANSIITRSGQVMVSNGGPDQHAVLSLENSSASSLPSVRVMGAGAQRARADQSTAWAVELSALNIRAKQVTDQFERVGIDNVNARVYVGNGAEIPTLYFGYSDGLMVFEGGSVCFVTDNTHDLGVTSRRPRYVRAGTGVQTGAFVQSARPSPATAGVGTSIFDTTLGKPLWSNGSEWVDATGTVV